MGNLGYVLDRFEPRRTQRAQRNNLLPRRKVLRKASEQGKDRVMLNAEADLVLGRIGIADVHVEANRLDFELYSKALEQTIGITA